MKIILFLVILLSLTFTACTNIDSSQNNPTCNELSELNEKANNGLFLLDSKIKEPTTATATIIGDPLVSFDDIKRVETYPEEDKLSILFTIDFDVGLKLSGITQRHISEYMALVVDDKVVIVSQIQAALGESFRLGGFDSNKDLDEIYSKFSCIVQK